MIVKSIVLLYIYFPISCALCVFLRFRISHERIKIHSSLIAKGRNNWPLWIDKSREHDRKRPSLPFTNALLKNGLFYNRYSGSEQKLPARLGEAKARISGMLFPSSRCLKLHMLAANFKLLGAPSNFHRLPEDT